MICLQKKRESLRKRSRAISTAFCLLLLVFTAAGCGKVEEPIPVQLSSGNVEELQNNAVGETEDDPEEAKPEDGDSDSEDVSDRAGKVDTGDDTGVNTEDGTKNNATQKVSQTDEERDADKSGKGLTRQDDSPGENVQQTEDAQPQSVGSAELDGNVRSIGADCFVVARNEVWSEGDADYAVGAAPGYEKEEDLITVYVNQNCGWEFKTVKNAGVNPEDVSTREGSFSDLQEGIAANIKGSWQDDGSFLADSIVMMIFV